MEHSIEALMGAEPFIHADDPGLWVESQDRSLFRTAATSDMIWGPLSLSS